MSRTVIPKDDLEWLRWLDDQIWKEVWGHDRFKGHYKYRKEHRRLKVKEWARFHKICQREDLMYFMANCHFGFQISISVYKPAEPMYPGLPNEPEHLITITPDHAPSRVEKEWRNQEGRGTFDASWDKWSPFTHSEENKAKLVWHGKRWLKDGAAEKSRYDY
jgi:hypothetical protein